MNVERFTLLISSAIVLLDTQKVSYFVWIYDNKFVSNCRNRLLIEEFLWSNKLSLWSLLCSTENTLLFLSSLWIHFSLEASVLKSSLFLIITNSHWIISILYLNWIFFILFHLSPPSDSSTISKKKQNKQNVIECFWHRILGYAFVHFRTKEAQQTALQPKYNGIVIKARKEKMNFAVCDNFAQRGGEEPLFFETLFLFYLLCVQHFQDWRSITFRCC